MASRKPVFLSLMNLIEQNRSLPLNKIIIIINQSRFVKKVRPYPRRGGPVLDHDHEREAAARLRSYLRSLQINREANEMPWGSGTCPGRRFLGEKQQDYFDLSGTLRSASNAGKSRCSGQMVGPSMHVYNGKTSEQRGNFCSPSQEGQHI